MDVWGEIYKRGEPYMAGHEQDQQAFYGPNLGYIIELYERFLEDKTSVD